MKRAERRQLERELRKEDKVYMITKKEYEKAVRTEVDKALDVLADKMASVYIERALLVMFYALKENGFGITRINRLLEKFNETCLCLESGHLCYFDLEKHLKDNKVDTEKMFQKLREKPLKVPKEENI